MPELGFCKPCLAKGHRCETNSVDLDGNHICAFCEDGEECPISKVERRKATLAAAAPVRKSRKKTAPDPPPAQPSPTRRKSNSPWGKFGSMGLNSNPEKQAPATPAIQRQKEQQSMATGTGTGLTPCHCGWGGMASSRWKYIKGHNPAGKAAAPIAAAPKKKAATPPAVRPLKVVSSQPLPADTVQISVTSAHLDSWFTQKPLTEKAQLFNNWIKESANA